MRTFNRAIITLIFLVVYSTLQAAPVVRSVKFIIYDADNNKPIPATVIVNGTSLTNGTYPLPADQDSRIALSVTAEAGEKYYSRTITIFLEGLNVAKPIFNIYLAGIQNNYIYTRGAVRKASEFINDEFADRAVALLERINQESSPSLMETQFGIYLKYNLARAYINNCTHKFVDQCNQGKEILTLLRNNYDKYSRMLSAEAVKKGDLDDKTPDDHYKRMEYLRAMWNMSAGRYDDAIKALDALIDEANQNSTITTTLKRSLDGLKSDRALAQQQR